MNAGGTPIQLCKGGGDVCILAEVVCEILRHFEAKPLRMGRQDNTSPSMVSVTSVVRPKFKPQRALRTQR